MCPTCGIYHQVHTDPPIYRGGWATTGQYTALRRLNSGAIRPQALLLPGVDYTSYSTLVSYGWAFYDQGLLKITAVGRRVLGVHRVTQFQDKADHRYAYFIKAQNFRAHGKKTKEFAEIAWEDRLITKAQYEYLLGAAEWFYRESSRWYHLYLGHTLHGSLQRRLVTDRDWVMHSISSLSLTAAKARNTSLELLSRDVFWRNPRGWNLSYERPNPDFPTKKSLRLRFWFGYSAERRFATELDGIFAGSGGTPEVNELANGPGRTRSYLNDLEVAELAFRGEIALRELGERLRAYATPLLDYLDDQVNIAAWLEAAWSCVPFLEAQDLPDLISGGMPIVRGGTGNWGRPKIVLYERVIPALKHIATLDDDPIEACRLLTRVMLRLAYCLRPHWYHGRIHPKEPSQQELLDVFSLDAHESPPEAPAAYEVHPEGPTCGDTPEGAPEATPEAVPGDTLWLPGKAPKNAPERPPGGRKPKGLIHGAQRPTKFRAPKIIIP